MLSRRESLSVLGVAGVSLATGALAKAQPGGNPQPARRAEAPFTLGGFDASKGTYVLDPLPYASDALEPFIDKQTMETHHGRHHAAYVAGANRALEKLAELRRDGRTGEAGAMRAWSRELSFNLGGHVNHTLFWKMMAPPAQRNQTPGTRGVGGGRPSGTLAQAIDRDLGSFDGFVEHFKAAAEQVEGGGWAWLAVEALSGRLLIVQMQSQQDQLPAGCLPVLGVDVWEHAYYLKYQNRRSEYLSAFLNVIHWPFCQWLYDGAIAKSSAHGAPRTAGE